MPIRVGTDLVLVESVQVAIDTHAHRYLDRIYTQEELHDCRSSQGVDPQRLAARFAAKEAALKVLRPEDEAVPWQAISVRRQPSGAPDLRLSGEAEKLAAEAGIADLAVSLAHEGAYASAVVVAEVRKTGSCQS